jgi:hypothetical protein
LPALVPNDCGGDCVAGMERQQDRSRCQQDTPWAWETLGYHRCMASRTFNIPKNKGTPKSVKIANPIDVAARYFVYKLYEATSGQPMQWGTLRGMGESPATIARAVERGWVILEGTSGKLLERKAVLTDEGRRLARRGR